LAPGMRNGKMVSAAPVTASRPVTRLPVQRYGLESMGDVRQDDFSSTPVLFRLYQRAEAAVETATSGFMLTSETYR
jgi:hypothetical protein